MTRGRPRGRLSSRVSLLILIILRETPADTSTLAYFLGKPARYIHNYLKHLRRTGFVYRDGVFWRLTDKGYAFLAKLEDCVRKLSTLEFLAKEIGKKWVRNGQEIGKKLQIIQNEPELEPIIKYLEENENSRSSSLNNIISVVEKRLGRELTEVEYAIVSFLYRKSQQLQRKYLWPPTAGVSLADWLAEETGYPSHLIASALRELESAGIVFLTQDRRRGVPKIRLDRSLAGD